MSGEPAFGGWQQCCRAIKHMLVVNVAYVQASALMVPHQ
jgi:hypothetical protein